MNYEIDKAIIEELTRNGEMDFNVLHARMKDRFNCDGAAVMMAYGRLVDEGEVNGGLTDENNAVKVRALKPKHNI
jgi:hypothetical protein